MNNLKDVIETGGGGSFKQNINRTVENAMSGIRKGSDPGWVRVMSTYVRVTLARTVL